MDQLKGFLRLLAAIILILVGLLFTLGAFGAGGSIGWIPIGLISLALGLVLIWPRVRLFLDSRARKVVSKGASISSRSRPTTLSRPKYRKQTYVWSKEVITQNLLIFLGSLVIVFGLGMAGFALIKASEELGGTLLVGGLPIALLFFAGAFAGAMRGLVSLYIVLNLTIRHFLLRR